MRTIQAYGYEVTGVEEIIVEIEEDLKDPKVRINWEKFNNSSRLWSYDGNTGYLVSINHSEHKVTLHREEKYQCVSTERIYTQDQLKDLFKFKEYHGYDGTFEDWIKHELDQGYIIMV